MKKIIYIFLSISLMIGTSALSSCARKSGCPMNEEATSKPNKKGHYKSGTSNLFDKQTRKKMGVK
ncbi:MAG TPA: hypothetical protein PK076_02295 [Saprospiraceae bacterium]|nr:hypothetical protein [Saprospiraceae bacterium]HQW54922.1 hypothetical protein [Saprospiraceae bacterium]